MTQADFDGLKVGDWVFVADPVKKSGHRRWAGKSVKLKIHGQNGRWYTDWLMGTRGTCLYFDPPDIELPARLGWPQSCPKCGAPAYHGLNKFVCSSRRH